MLIPLKKGRKHVVGRPERFGVEREVEKALHLFGLPFPVSSAEIKRKYRASAMAHHPDRNASSSGSKEKVIAKGPGTDMPFPTVTRP